MLQKRVKFYVIIRFIVDETLNKFNIILNLDYPYYYQIYYICLIYNKKLYQHADNVYTR